MISFEAVKTFAVKRASLYNLRIHRKVLLFTTHNLRVMSLIAGQYLLMIHQKLCITYEPWISNQLFWVQISNDTFITTFITH